MKNFEKYKDYLIKAIAVCNSDELLELAGIEYNMDYYGTKKSLVDWLLQDYKEPILDKVEREYLSAVIRPFRKNVINICKLFYYEGNKQYISIQVRYESGYSDYVNLTNFNADTMYKGMKVEKGYTLEELDL